MEINYFSTIINRLNPMKISMKIAAATGSLLNFNSTELQSQITNSLYSFNLSSSR